jgi:L-ascorbate metabolism protein UlaG (beta-lactamase superfamily)
MNDGESTPRQPGPGLAVGLAAGVGPPGGGAARLTYVGHGTVLIEQSGSRVLTDPLLRRHMGPLLRRGPLPTLAVTEDLDAILITHLHIDHLDVRSLRLLDRGVPVLVPAHGAALIRRQGFTSVESLAPGEVTEVAGMRVEATPAYHGGKRYPVTRAGHAVGYVIGAGPTFYYAGDTGLFPGMAEFAERVDVALLPISGWGVTLPDDHLNPLTAAKALEALRPRVAVPVHYGVYYPPGMLAVWRGRDVLPPRAFARYAGLLAPEVEVRIVPPGESTIVT